MERNLIGEMNMMKESGAKPNFTDIARRYGVDRRTVARYWNGGGPQPADAREGHPSGFDRYRAEIEEKANFPYVKTLADFDFSFQPSIDRPVVEELAALGFPGRRENVVLVGSPGVGKTHIAVALGVEAVRARKLTYFVDCQRLVGDLKRAAEKGALERRMRFYSHLSLLIVDEVGYLDVDKEGADLLFQLVSRRYERRSTIVTTNVGIGAWAKVFGDPVVASAIADRLCHHCTVLKITGRSYRTKGLAPDRDAGNGA